MMLDHMQQAQRPHPQSACNQARGHLNRRIEFQRQRAADEHAWYREARQTHVTEGGSD